MNDNQLLFAELADKYSKAYYKKVSDLFELDELAQEIWMLLLELEEENAYDPSQGASKRTFLVSAIQNRMGYLIRQEIYRKRTVYANGESADIEPPDESPTPEDTLIGKETLALLSGKIKHIKNGEFVLNKHLEGYSIRETSKLAKEQGIRLPKSNVHYILTKIRKEATKIMLDK